MLIQNITDILGNTPIIEINPGIHGLKNIDLYAKLEYLNPFGSLKDRTAYGMLKENLNQIKSRRLTVIETSSGNTAKALQCICGINGVDFMTVTNRIRVSESKNILQFLGTNIVEMPKGIDTVAKIEEMVAEDPDKYFHTRQYSNKNNVEAHHATGREIFEDIGAVNYFISVLGTSGSSKGISEYLKAKNPQMKTIGVVTSKDSYIPGIRTASEMKECGIFSKDNYDHLEEVDCNVARSYMKKMGRELGVLAGVSSGASFAASVRYLRSIDEGLTERQKAVFIVCDRLETYANFIKENRFYKYHVLGNTYIVIDPAENPVNLTNNFIRDICSVEYGVGADGIIYGPFVQDGEYSYKSYNRDGSEARSAVFATMIFAKYLKDKEIVKSENVKVRIADQKMTASFLNMEATRIMVKLNTPVITGKRIICGREFTCVNVGNENIVGEEQELSKQHIIKVGEQIRESGEYPDGINIQLVHRLSFNQLQVETYERGVGYTLASGTSIVAACFAQKDNMGKTISVHTAGGICISDNQENSITAEVFKIYEGEYEV